mgnify:CR=1 FL=1
MAISEKYIVDDPPPGNPLLVKDGEPYTGEEEEDEEPEEDEENDVIWKGENAD